VCRTRMNRKHTRVKENTLQSRRICGTWGLRRVCIERQYSAHTVDDYVRRDQRSSFAKQRPPWYTRETDRCQCYIKLENEQWKRAAGYVVDMFVTNGHHTSSVNFEPLDPSKDGWLRPKVPRGRGVPRGGLCGRLKFEPLGVPPKGGTSSG
jgi:hypothetical protein